MSSKRGSAAVSPNGSAAKRANPGSVVAVLLVGGPSKGTRFRPLSLDCPKPLIPIAGKPMIDHAIYACKTIPNLKSIFLLGFYEEREFSVYSSRISAEIGLPVRYIKETKGLGSAGGLHAFRETFTQDDPSFVVIINGDVCCSFPLAELLESHKSRPEALGTVLIKRVTPAQAKDCGEVVADPVTKEMLHYTERPESLVSDVIDTGVYAFSSPALFDVLSTLVEGTPPANMERAPSMNSLALLKTRAPDVPKGFLRLGEDLLERCAGKKLLYVHETDGFWEMLKTPGLALKGSEHYLSQYRTVAPGSLLAAKPEGPHVAGNVFVHAGVHPTAKLGPNVAVGPNARIGAGVRLMNCIILDDVEIREHACIQNSIVGWKSVIGRWSRLQGSGEITDKHGVTILGEDVVVCDEVVVSGCIVLPHKEIKEGVKDETIL